MNSMRHSGTARPRGNLGNRRHGADHDALVALVVLVRILGPESERYKCLGDVFSMVLRPLATITAIIIAVALISLAVEASLSCFAMT